MRLKLGVALVALVVFAADRLTKMLVERSLELRQSVEVCGDLVRLTHIRNSGVVFGLMSEPGHPLGGWPILLLSAVVIAALIGYLWTLPSNELLLHGSLALVLGGALGNFWDRVRQGYVTDFVDVSLSFVGLDSRWPAFNVADSAICVGVALMLIDVWRARPEPTAAA